jgi:hypothetical protein
VEPLVGVLTALENLMVSNYVAHTAHCAANAARMSSVVAADHKSLVNNISAAFAQWAAKQG